MTARHTSHKARGAKGVILLAKVKIGRVWMVKDRGDGRALPDEFWEENGIDAVCLQWLRGDELIVREPSKVQSIECYALSPLLPPEDYRALQKAYPPIAQDRATKEELFVEEV